MLLKERFPMAIKMVIIIAVAGVFLTVLLQNTQVVSVRFLFWQISMSRIILLPLILLVGFIAGFITGRITKK